MKWKLLMALCITFATVACGGNNSTTTAAENNPPANSAHSQNSAAKINWVSYTDTAEGAFSMDVPVGYQIQGGMYRFGYFDVRWMMEARSLDGKIIIRIDDVNVPPYSLPGPHTGTEGQRNFQPQQYQMITARYRDGQTYAESYAKHRFSGVCKSMNPRTADWIPAFSPEMKDDPGTRSTDGNVSYDCDSTDGPRIASVFVHSTLNQRWRIVVRVSCEHSQQPRSRRASAFDGGSHDRQLEEKSGMGAAPKSNHASGVSADRQKFRRIHEANADVPRATHRRDESASRRILRAAKCAGGTSVGLGENSYGAGRRARSKHRRSIRDFLRTQIWPVDQ